MTYLLRIPPKKQIKWMGSGKPHRLRYKHNLWFEDRFGHPSKVLIIHNEDKTRYHFAIEFPSKRAAQLFALTFYYG